MRTLRNFLMVGMVLCSGCDQSKKPSPSENFDARSRAVTPQAKPETQSGVDSLANPKTATQATLNCLKDKAGNAIKVVVSNHEAAMYSTSSNKELIRRCSLMEKSFLFGSENNRLHAGPNPRIKGVGWLDSNDAYLTSNMQFVRFNAASRVFRQPVSGFASISDLEGFVTGKSIKPSLIESKLGNEVENSWMPILDSRSISVGNAKVQVMELGAWTIRLTPEETSPSATTSASNAQMNPADLQDTMNQYRIVLCIDATSSMQLTWITMAKRIQEIIRKTLGESSLSIEIAIVAYRDHDADSLWVNKASPFTHEIDVLQKWLKAMVPKGGGDWEERVFEALMVSADLLSRPEHSKAYKSILLVGDNAGKTDGAEPILGSVGKQVLERCATQGISISSLQMPYHPKFRGDKTLFGEQLKVLTEKTSGSRFDISAEETNESNAVDAIVSALLRTKEEALIEAKIAKDLNEGVKLETIRERAGLPEAALTWKLENIHRRTEGRLKIDSHSDLGVDRIWVIHDSRAFDSGVLIPGYDLDLLISVLDRLITLSADKPAALAEIWGQLASQNLGEDVPLSEALRVESTLPIRDNLLSITLSELIVMPRAQRKAWASEVEKKFNALVAWKNAHKPENGNFIIPTSVLP